MEGFTYHNIFDTKGTEYLIIIAFFALLIPFWILLNRRVQVTRFIRRTIGILTASMIRVPQGLFFSRFHTWAHLESSGVARVGLDDLLLHITGPVTFKPLKKKGDRITKGELLAEIDRGGKYLRLVSPISGEIAGANPVLEEGPEQLNLDPYRKGWMFEIKPSAWVEETSEYFLAETATNWIMNELERFKSFLADSVMKVAPNPSAIILQDGGELIDGSLAELPEEVWKDFQKQFLEQKNG